MANKDNSLQHYYWHVLLLGSLIFSHPLFKTIGAQPEFLLAHNLTGLKLLSWVIVIGVLPGLILVTLAYGLNKLFPAGSRYLKPGFLWVLFSLFIFNTISNSIGSGLMPAIVISCLLAAVVVRLYSRTVFLRTFMSVASLLVIITPLQFCFSNDVRQILMPQQSTSSDHSGMNIDKTPVVILVFDELPLLSLLDDKGNINAERFPNFSRFSSNSTWYKYATTVAEATLNAVPPILTGKLTGPSNKVLPIAANYPENIFTLLSTSHEINAFETFTQICPEDLCKSTRADWRLISEDTLVVYAHAIAPDHFKKNLPQIDNKWVGYMRVAGEARNLHNDEGLHPHHRYKVRLDKFNRFMFELETIEPASLNYLHILIPHSPWMYLPDGRVYSQAELRPFTGTLPPGSAGAKQTSQLYSQPHLAAFVQQRHLLQVGYVDKLLGDVIGFLQQRNLYDDALIVVMADHGASFRPGESLREANPPSYQDILSIPLFIKYPGQQKAKTDLRSARTVDVLPTILDALNSDVTVPDFDGKSLLQANTNEDTILGLQRDTGRILEYQVSEFKERFEQTVISRKAEFTNGDFDQIYSLNDQGLLNKPVQQLNVGEPVEYQLRLNNPHMYKNMDLTSNSIPSLIRANRISQGESPVSTVVAVSVNGIVRAVSVLQNIDTVEFDFQALVDPDSFQTGKNSVDFFAVASVNGTTSLLPIRFETDHQVELIRQANEALSLNFDTQLLEVSDSGRFGEITIVADPKSDQIRLTGWAASSDNGQVAEEIFIFSGSELIASARPHSRHPKAQEVTGFSNSENSGFKLVMPLREALASEPESLSVIAVFNAEKNPLAGELRYLNNAKHLFKNRDIKLIQEVLPQNVDKSIIEPGRIYDFSSVTEAQQFSGTGWSIGSSGEARWNATKQASLSFKVGSDKQVLDLVVQSSPFFVKGKLETQLIEASLSSGTTQSIKLQHGETDGKFIIHITPEDIDANGAIVVSLKFPNAASPKSLDVNSDPRLLALKVKSLQVLIAEKRSD